MQQASLLLKRSMSSMAGIYGHAAVLETVVLVPGQLTKEIVVAGTGNTSPPRGANVSAHYVGKLTDGSDFDSSKKRGKPFQFPIGMGRVIKGWDVGIASMRKGEKAVFTISPSYGYGAAGAGGVIPPNATLLFEVELLDWM
jgi:FKBP-type peptidyl-prolyl cis-trans isomerase